MIADKLESVMALLPADAAAARVWRRANVRMMMLRSRSDGRGCEHCRRRADIAFRMAGLRYRAAHPGWPS